MISFRLDKEPWIPVIFKDGTQRLVSLEEAISLSEFILRISGNPLETSCLYRLLFAIALTSCRPANEREWSDLWNARTSVISKMLAYVAHHDDRFDLYSASHPFLQHAGIKEATKPPGELVYDRARGNNPVFLDAATAKDPSPLRSDAAARALLTVHAYSGSGLGAPNPLNSNKKDQMLAGPLCGRLVGLVEGNSLAKTITLNLLTDNKRWRTGTPNWEANPGSMPCSTRPDGVADMFTRPTRNARLKPNESGSDCVAIQLYQGAAVEVEEGAQQDPMIPMYLAADKKFKPLRLDPEKALWRNAEVIFASEDDNRCKPIAALREANNHYHMGRIPEGESLALRVLGVAADAQGPRTTLWRDETLPFNFEVIAKEKRYSEMANAVKVAEDTGDKLRRRVYVFAKSYLTMGEGAPDKNNVQRLADELGPAVTHFWQQASTKGERIPLEGEPPEWAQTLDKLQISCFHEAVAGLPDSPRRYKAQYSSQGPAKP